MLEGKGNIIGESWLELSTLLFFIVESLLAKVHDRAVAALPKVIAGFNDATLLLKSFKRYSSSNTTFLFYLAKAIIALNHLSLNNCTSCNQWKLNSWS